MSIAIDTMDTLAGLAKIGLTDDEKQRFTRDLEGMAAFAGILAGLDTDGVAAATHSIDLHNAYREDVPIPPLPREELLANASRHDGACFLTPKVLDEG